VINHFEKSDITRSERKRRSGFNLLSTIKKPKTDVIEVTWDDVCDEIHDVLDGTIPILKEKLANTENEAENDHLEYFLSKTMNLICESLVLKINNFFLRSTHQRSSQSQSLF